MAREKINPTDEEIYELGTLCTRDEAGRHFTETSACWGRLESLGLIKIARPVHEATGIPYSCEHWTVEVTPAGQAIVDERWEGIAEDRTE